jgi:hypothetical protein
MASAEAGTTSDFAGSARRCLPRKFIRWIDILRYDRGPLEELHLGYGQPFTIRELSPKQNASSRDALSLYRHSRRVWHMVDSDDFGGDGDVGFNAVIVNLSMHFRIP